MESDQVLPHVNQRLLHLAGQLADIQDRVDQLAADLQQDSLQVNALVTHLTDTQSTTLLQERLAGFTEQMNTNHEQLSFLGNRLTELATQDQLVRLATLIATQDQVMELADAVKEMNRIQERTNMLGESKDQQLDSVMQTLQEIVTRREQLQEQHARYDQDRQESIKRTGRGEFAADLLPALDGLELSLARGEAILARQRRDLATVTHGATPREDDKTAASAGLLDRLRPKRGGEDEIAGQPNHPVRLPESMLATTQAMQEWLYQVKLVHDRFHALLSAEGVEPVATLRETFDPHLHIAVGTEARSDVPANTIVREIRKGYRQSNRVLRYAEVVVARSPDAQATS